MPTEASRPNKNTGLSGANKGLMFFHLLNVHLFTWNIGLSFTQVNVWRVTLWVRDTRTNINCADADVTWCNLVALRQLLKKVKNNYCTNDGGHVFYFEKRTYIERHRLEMHSRRGGCHYNYHLIDADFKFVFVEVRWQGINMTGGIWNVDLCSLKTIMETQYVDDSSMSVGNVNPAWD